MVVLKVDIVRFVDDYQPGMVECRFKDSSGQEWYIIDKLPLFTSTHLDEKSQYPQPGTLACQVVATRRDTSGREVVSIDTEQPWHVEATTGETRFDVWPEQLSEE